MTAFLDLLEAYHHWCVSGDCSRLESCKGWLTTLTPAPSDEMGWHRLGTEAIDWLTPFPAEWQPHWRMLSPRQMSLTVEALEYLEAHRPGAIAAAIDRPSQTLRPSPQQPVPLSPTPTSQGRVPSPPVLSGVSTHWSLSDVISCVNREVQKREAAYPQLVQQGRLSQDRARQELGQMQAALEILMAMRDKGQDARQQALFE